MSKPGVVAILAAAAILAACTSSPDNDAAPAPATTIPLDLPSPTGSRSESFADSTPLPDAPQGTPESSTSASPSASAGTAGTSTPSPSQRPSRTLAVVSPTDGSEVTRPVVIEVEVSGFALTELTGHMADDTGHLYAFVDETPPPDRVRMPMSQSIVTSADTTIELPDLAPGEHTVTVVATHAYPVPFEPRVADTVTFTLRE